MCTSQKVASNSLHLHSTVIIKKSNHILRMPGLQNTLILENLTSAKTWKLI